MTSLPLGIFDVDGVLAPLSGPGFPPEPAVELWGRENFIQTSDLTHGLWFIKPVVEWLVNVHESGRMEVRWQTTWRNRAQTEIAVELGLPHWELMDLSSAWRDAPGWWKTIEVERASAEGRRLIWVDDDMDDSIRNGEVAEELIANRNALLLSPHFSEGITPSMLQAMEEQLQRWENTP